jgi:hypothetical protein
MSDSKKMNQFTLLDIIERQIHFTNKNNIFDKKEYQDYDEGRLMAYNEMLVDVKVMGENEFVSKYLIVINKLKTWFENSADEREIEKMSGYNNAIVSILKCVNPIYEYDVND